VRETIIIGIGGFIGAVLRYWVSGWVQHWSRSAAFPFGTLGVNVIGCFLIGLLAYLVEVRGIFTAEMRLFLFIGFLGAFTTYSTFSNETLTLIRDAESASALLNIGMHLFWGLLAVWLGRSLAQAVWR